MRIHIPQWCTRGIAVLAIAVPLTVLAAPTVGATQTKCDPNRTNNGVSYFDGWFNTGTAGQVGGIYSNIENYSPWVYPNSSVSAWSMLDNPSEDNWAQAGWIEYAYGTRYSFVEYTTSPGNYTTQLYPAYAVGDYTYYTTMYDGANSYFTFQIASNTMYQIQLSWVPDQAQNYGEIHTLADQMPGNRSWPEDFSSTYWWDATGWKVFNGYANNTGGGYFSNMVMSSTDDQIFDNACP